ncbi:MAG: hypothetical protein FD170_1059 [Bacteroidetes bacterium]|nr:MAG: hypothetical protein FD170_1059 [Bacteroidota bacterium]
MKYQTSVCKSRYSKHTRKINTDLSYFMYLMNSWNKPNKKIMLTILVVKNT